MKLPKWILDILTTMILPLVKLAGKNGLVDWLKTQQEKNPNFYRSVIIFGYRAVKVDLRLLADKTVQDWDNDTLDVVASAFETSAAEYNVPLPDVEIIVVPELPAPVQ